jgi:hypothetical protein
MGIFGKKEKPGANGRDKVPALAFGLRLDSGLDIERSLTALERAIRRFREPAYRYLPLYFETGCRWLGQGAAPTKAVSFDDRGGKFVLAALWPNGSGSAIYLYCLGSRKERLGELSASIIADWGHEDASLTVVGPGGEGTIVLAPPMLPPTFVNEYLAVAGKEPTPQNTAEACRVFGMMFAGNGANFISQNSQAAADAFLMNHRPQGVPSLAYLQSILDGIAEVDFQLLPYIQELPIRARAIAMERVSPKR